MTSLGMEVEQTASGRWLVAAPWLDGPVDAETFEDAYWEAIARRSRHSPGR